MKQRDSFKRRTPEALWAGGALFGLGLGVLALNPVPTTLNDFFVPGTQPGDVVRVRIVDRAPRFAVSEVVERLALDGGE